ncbi:uncharacterized protein M6B38_357375 [Iris pallida]|nr:uncharacterized protein M6B38_357375 [Iris pallida]
MATQGIGLFKHEGVFFVMLATDSRVVDCLNEKRKNVWALHLATFQLWGTGDRGRAVKYGRDENWAYLAFASYRTGMDHDISFEGKTSRPCW